MKDNELITIIVKSFIAENNFKFKPIDIKNLLKDAIDVKINKVKVEFYDSVKVLYVYFGTKNKKCLTFSIHNKQIKVEQIIE